MKTRDKYTLTTPRAASDVHIACFASPNLFGEWDQLSKAVQDYFTRIDNSIPCECTGGIGSWCVGCRFSGVTEPEE